MPQCHRTRLLQDVAEALEALKTTGQEQILYLNEPPFTDADLDILRGALGRGSITIFSNDANACAWQETEVPCVWLGEYRNGIERVVLRTVEIGPYPPLAAWRKESLTEAAQRLSEILTRACP